MCVVGDRLFVAADNGICSIDSAGVVSSVAGKTRDADFADNAGPNARFSWPEGLAASADGAVLYAADGNNRLRAIDLHTRVVRTVAGDGARVDRDGVGLDSSLYEPRGLCWDAAPGSARVLFIASSGSLRRFDVDTGTGPAGRPLPFVSVRSHSRVLRMACDRGDRVQAR
jgi:hypothetical protein